MKILSGSNNQTTIDLPYIKLITFSEESADALNKMKLTSPINSLDTKNAVGEFRKFDDLLIMKQEMEDFFSNSFSL